MERNGSRRCGREHALRMVGHAAFAFWLLLGTALPMMAVDATGQTPVMPGGALAGFLRGEIKGIGKDYLSINDKRYDVREDVLVMDDRDQPRQWKDLEVGSLVAYHLKFGRIDQLVLILPK